MARTGLIFGGKSAEHLVSVRSARAVSAALLAGGHEVVPIGIDGRGVVAPLHVAADVLASNSGQVPHQTDALGASYSHVLEALPLDVAFPIVHGTFGEDGTMQGLLAMLDVPCVGADTMTSAVCMDKAMCKRALTAAGLDVVEWVLVDETTPRAQIEARAQTLPAPWFVKPSVGGSSVGCKKANDVAALHDAVTFALRFDDAVIIERCVSGRELEVAVLGPRGALEASVIGEIVPGADFYDYKDKYLDDKAGLIAPRRPRHVCGAGAARHRDAVVFGARRRRHGARRLFLRGARRRYAAHDGERDKYASRIHRDFNVPEAVVAHG